MTIKLLSSHSLSFKRYSAGYYNDNGLWVSPSPTIINTTGSLQPISGAERRTIKDSGKSAEDSRVYYTKTKLNTDNQHSKTQADTTTIGSLTYTVFSVAEWSGYGLASDHYKIILVRDDREATL